MKFNFKRGLITSGLAASILVFASYSPVFATDNVTLSAIKVEGTNDAFTITLKTSKDTEISSKVQSPNRLMLELSNTKAAELIKTQFKNAGQIEDVIVQPLKDNKTRILLSGNNVSKSRIILDSTQTPVVADKFAEENSQNNRTASNNSTVTVPNNTVTPQQNAIEKAAAANQVVNSKDFIEQNTNNTQVQAATTNAITSTENEVINTTNETIQPTIEKQTAETTGVDATPSTSEIPSSEVNNINAEATDNQSLDSSLFQPAADLETPNADAKTTISNQDSAAVATAKSISNAQDNSILSNSWLLRFGIIFVFVTLLVAYLRKEKILTFKLKGRKQQLNTEHLDIYRSLHNSTKLSPPYNRVPTASRNTALTNNAKQQYNKTASLSRQSGNNRSLTQHTALNNYNSQKAAPKNSAMKAIKLAPSYNSTGNISNTRSAATKGSLNRTPSDNITFLKSMAEIYEKSGRHDLAMTIQKKIRQSTAKV